ncbi:MAG: bifunctional alpha,alpha-trehalose-phosphate synthase (UDP-forming)/trehalose-phosphatase [Planctomycetes bacterium]|nr:bifunctional alpha,alpha-trehalose-phosphate synthase (UDP-forming)/trehalose-phosphatase [Planctomycetota bacterium]
MSAPQQAGSGRLILVSNRLPVVISQGEQGYHARVAAGGLATGLSGPHRESGGRWIGWPGVVSQDGSLTPEVHALLNERMMVGVGLSEAEHEAYYTRISNRGLWPLFHYFPERMRFDAGDWEVYRDVNRRFSDAVLEEIQPGDFVFVQDFHLTLLPAMLREARPELPIGFFLHIPFPSSEIYRIFARREEVLEGLLGADVVGFHTLGYVRHFRSAISHLLGVETRGNRAYHQGRQIQLLAHPLGIHTPDWEGGGEDEPEVQREMQELRQAIAGRRLILGVERLDYTKGVPERLRAYASLLRENPSLADEIMMIQIAVPSRVEVEEYRELKDEVDRLAGDINSEFGRPGRQALHYQFRGVPPHVLRALYRLADVCLVTPLRDGLNLVAKEFVASRRDDDGVLVLSENTGAAWELGEALRVNAFDDENMVRTLKRALDMPLEEQTRRMAAMRKRVAEKNVHVWAREMVDAIRSAEPLAPPPALAGEAKQRLLNKWKKADRRVLFLDYDGTLRSFTDAPEDAVPDATILQTLSQLAGRADVATWVVSGRPSDLLDEWLGKTGVGLIAEHGASVRAPGETEFRSLTHDLPLGWREEVRAVFAEFTDRVPGSHIEEKPLGLAWHYRQASPEQAAWQARELFRHLEEGMADQPVEVMRGNKVIEVRPAGVSKGRAALRVLASAPGERPFVLACGDDITDESMFRDLPAWAWTVLVGARESSARQRLADPAACLALLTELAATETVQAATGSVR